MLTINIKAQYPQFTVSTCEKNEIKDKINQFMRTHKQFGLKKIFFTTKKYNYNNDTGEIEEYEKLLSDLNNNQTIHLDLYPIATDAQTLFEHMITETGGWQDIGKEKPVATFNSGNQSWFIENWKKFLTEEKKKFLNLMSINLKVKNGYDINIEIYEPPEPPEGVQYYQYFFYDTSFFSKACEVIGIDQEVAKKYVGNWTSSGGKKQILINLVFNDYCKSYEREKLVCNAEYMEIFNKYRESVGLPKIVPDEKPSVDISGGYINKYLKYKNKYLKLKNHIKS